MKKMKRPRGFYKELKPFREFSKRIGIVEFWLKHKFDSNKDIRFYVRFKSPTQIGDAFDYLSKLSSDEYEDSTLTRSIDQPSTRKERAIYKFIISTVPHLDKVR